MRSLLGGSPSSSSDGKHGGNKYRRVGEFAILVNHAEMGQLKALRERLGDCGLQHKFVLLRSQAAAATAPLPAPSKKVGGIGRGGGGGGAAEELGVELPRMDMLRQEHDVREAKTASSAITDVPAGHLEDAPTDRYLQIGGYRRGRERIIQGFVIVGADNRRVWQARKK